MSVDAWIIDIFSGFCLLFISLPHSQNLTRNTCCLAKQNEKLCYLKTTLFLVLAFAVMSLLRRPKEGERGLLGTIVESREERKAWFLALELQGQQSLLCLNWNHLPSRDHAGLDSVVTSMDRRTEGHPWTFALSKLLGPTHHCGNGEAFLMMTDGLRIRLTYI